MYKPMYRLTVLLATLFVMATPTLGQELPGIKADLDFDAMMKTLDLENPALEFLYKSGKHEGSSIGFHIAEPGRRKSGTFAPYNSSSDPEAEVVSYRLARFLGVSGIYNPVGYYQLGPLAAGRFKALLRKHSESDPDRAANYARIAGQLNANPKSIFGIYRSRPRGNKYVVNSLGTGGQFNMGHALSAVIQAYGPMPSDRLVSFPGVKGRRAEYAIPSEKQSELARQLSTIMVIDQLIGQWDRFWRNLEATGDENGRLQLLARDNGGANMDDGWEWFPLYDKWVSRYDREMMKKLQDLNAFLQGRNPSFAGYADVEAWKTAAGFRKASSYRTFKRKLDLLAGKRLVALEKKYGSRTYFAANIAKPDQGDAAPRTDK